MTATLHKFTALLPSAAQHALESYRNMVLAGDGFSEKQMVENILLAYINALPMPEVDEFLEAAETAQDDDIDQHQMSPVPGYSPLADVLVAAYDQSAFGKGKERHANGKPFLMQPIMSIGRMVGPGYQLGQAMKKSQEAGSMFNRGNISAAKAELLGVIVYTAAAILLMQEQETKL